MKIWGIVFIVFGIFWTVAGFLSYKSDVQVGIALAGINMLGIGSIMVHLGSVKSTKSVSDGAKENEIN
jgi:hypothetical protein